MPLPPPITGPLIKDTVGLVKHSASQTSEISSPSAFSTASMSWSASAAISMTSPPEQKMPSTAERITTA
ncbi:MAG: hypothetical protein J0I75_08120 [Hyphomicrobium sp.]|nr:hypothetical protein [Hyphomicrobium sp.]